MTNRNDWQVFYRQQVKKMGDLIHLPEVLPPRLRQEAKGEEIDLAEPSPTETKPHRNKAPQKQSSTEIKPRESQISGKKDFVITNHHQPNQSSSRHAKN